MIVDIGHISRVIKNLIYFILIFLAVLVILKLFIFFLPFLIAVLIANILEPLIKKMMNIFKISRKASTVICIVGIFMIIAIISILAVSTIISESYKLLENLKYYIPSISKTIDGIINSVNIDKLNVPSEIKTLFQSSSENMLETIGIYISNFLKGILDIVTKLPEIIIFIIITVLATYFICADRYYIKDQIEYHIPRAWARKFNNHFKGITIELVNYIKAEAILVIIGFIIVLIGFYVLEFLGFDIGFPLISAIGVGLVDALPILGSGTVLIPYAIFSSLSGNINLGIGLIIIYSLTLIIRQILEPKIVSNKIGIHPIFTLISMYAGFKIIGILGLILGPIILIIYKNIFESLIEKGIVKTIFEKM